MCPISPWFRITLFYVSPVAKKIFIELSVIEVIINILICFLKIIYNTEYAFTNYICIPPPRGRWLGSASPDKNNL